MAYPTYYRHPFKKKKPTRWYSKRQPRRQIWSPWKQIDTTRWRLSNYSRFRNAGTRSMAIAPWRNRTPLSTKRTGPIESRSDPRIRMPYANQPPSTNNLKYYTQWKNQRLSIGRNFLPPPIPATKRSGRTMVQAPAPNKMERGDWVYPPGVGRRDIMNERPRSSSPFPKRQALDRDPHITDMQGTQPDMVNLPSDAPMVIDPT